MKIKAIKNIFIISMVLFLTGCSDFLDINTDPNDPTEPEYALLLTDGQLHMSHALSYGTGGLTTLLGVYTHQTVTRQSYDAYGIAGADFEIETPWTSLYSGALADFEAIINEASAEQEADETVDNGIYIGIAKILKAYSFSQIVDVWGDVPFSEALYPLDYRSPVYDDDEAIYPQLIDLLDSGIENLDNSRNSLSTPGASDLIYGGNVDRWIKAANSIKLKLYTQIRLHQDVSAEIAAVLNDGVMESIADDFELQYGADDTPENRHPGFLVDYASTQITQYVSPWFYETMMGMTTDNHQRNPFAGIKDPRIPYYFVNQIKEGDASDGPTEYRHEDSELGSFITINFGSIGPDRDHAQRGSATMLGIYPVGGKYNDATFDESIDSDFATGACPQRFLTYKDVLYLKAELALLGIISEDPKTLLQEAIEASFEKVDDVVNKVEPDQDVPKLHGTTGMDDYVAAILAVYDAADEDGKLEVIMTQKWISSFGSAVDQYNDYRRTNYPVMFDPKTDNNPFTEVSRDYPLSMPWANGDLTLNENAPSQKLIASSGVFWDVQN